jgi:hypothetical protein
VAKVSELKAQARALELQGELEKALRVYTHIVTHLEGSNAILQELPLYVKAGDLHLKLGRPHDAAEMYERAARHYVSHGSTKSVLALCDKVLRARPDAADVHIRWARGLLDAGHVEAARGVLGDYASRSGLDDLNRVLARIENRAGESARSLIETLLEGAATGEREPLERAVADVAARLRPSGGTTRPSGGTARVPEERPRRPSRPTAAPEPETRAPTPEPSPMAAEAPTPPTPAISEGITVVPEILVTPPSEPEAADEAQPAPEPQPVAEVPRPPEAPGLLETTPQLDVESQLAPAETTPGGQAEGTAGRAAPPRPPGPPIRRPSGPPVRRPSAPPSRVRGRSAPGVLAQPPRRRSRALPVAVTALVVVVGAAAALVLTGVVPLGGRAGEGTGGVAAVSMPPSDTLSGSTAAESTATDSTMVDSLGAPPLADGAPPGRVATREPATPTREPTVRAARGASVDTAAAAAAAGDTVSAEPEPLAPPPAVAIQLTPDTAGELPFPPIVVSGLDVERQRPVTVGGRQGVEVVQLLGGNGRLTLTSLPLDPAATDVPEAGSPRVTAAGDSAIGVARFGSYEVRARAAIGPDSLSVLLVRLTTR